MLSILTIVSIRRTGRPPWTRWTLWTVCSFSATAFIFHSESGEFFSAKARGFAQAPVPTPMPRVVSQYLQMQTIEFVLLNSYISAFITYIAAIPRWKGYWNVLSSII